MGRGFYYFPRLDRFLFALYIKSKRCVGITVLMEEIGCCNFTKLNSLMCIAALIELVYERYD